MNIYIVFANGRGSYYEDDCDIIKKIFSSKNAAEKYVLEDVLEDVVSDMFNKIEVSDRPGVTWYYFMEGPVYRIEEHCVED